jgi:membrane-bound lytic murein transglycosylase D
MRLLIRAILLVVVTAILLAAGCQTTRPTATYLLSPHAAAPTAAAPADPAPEPEPQPTTADITIPKQDPTELLISQAEKEYAAGQANYKAGHLEAAKANFDRAFDLLLSSNQDLRNDERLEREFDKIVEAVHALELAALKQGDGFSEPRSEPAPIDEANDVTFPVDPNIKAQAQAEIKTTKSDLPLVLNDQVASFINYFSSPRGRATLEHAWARSGRYREMISRILQQEGVPQDLIYLAQAESGFQSLALSRAGARGMWQFMAQSGALYGLERSWWVDERQDPEKATLAAARHLKDLYKQFGDWYLAMAAYNSGASTVQHAVERTGYADFWELYRRGVLPQETRNYVPIILAETIMLKNPDTYGLAHVTPEPQQQTDPINIDYPVDLRLVAECVDTSVDKLQELNPSLLRMTTPKDQGFTLKLPAGTRERYETAIAAIPVDMRTWWRYHQVEYGDSLASISRRYHTSASLIAEANNLMGDEVRVGAKLIIPVAPGKTGDSVTYSRHATHYKVRKGDTLDSVADDFEVPADKLKKWNHLRGSALVPGRTLLIYKPTASASPEAASSSQGSAVSKGTRTPKTATAAASGKTGTSKSAQYHKVKKGETLSSIAQSYNTSVAALRRDNPKLAASLRAGDVLVIH